MLTRSFKVLCRWSSRYYSHHITAGRAQLYGGAIRFKWSLSLQVSRRLVVEEKGEDALRLSAVLQFYFDFRGD